MPDESIHFALLTHIKSKYFENSHHANFDLLIKSYENNSFNIQSNNIISDDDVSRIQVFSQILDIFILLKSMIVVRSNIIRCSRSFFFLFNLKQAVSIIYNFIFLLIILCVAVFSSKFYRHFRKNLIRQSNISAGHINLMNLSLKSNKRYILILEDDFLIQDIEAIIKMLKFATSAEISKSNIQLLNLSKSFSYLELGFQNFVGNSIKNSAHPNCTLDVLKYPVTNTVCATLYKADFLIKLISELESQKHISIIPIDHKINIALNRLIKKGLIDKECYGSSNPSLFIQGSLHG
jgi:hypothetical protein